MRRQVLDADTSLQKFIAASLRPHAGMMEVRQYVAKREHVI